MNNNGITVIWTDWGDEDSKALEMMWRDVPRVQLLHITKWNSIIEKTVDLAIASEQNTLLFCGHGSSYGLMAPKSLTEYVIHQTNVPTIKAKNVIGIMCHASSFAERVDLHGLFSGMFISNVNEACDYCVHVGDDENITESNAEILRKINKLLLGELGMEECLESIKTSNADSMITHFNINGFIIR